MARVRVGSGPTTPAAERTLSLPGTEAPGATTSAPAPMVDPLGVQYGVCACGLEQSIGILAKNGGRCASCGKGVNIALAPVDPKTLTPDPAHAKKSEPEDIERAAIQEEAKGLGASFFGSVSIPKAVEDTLAAASVEKANPQPPSNPPAANLTRELVAPATMNTIVQNYASPEFIPGDEISVTIGEELYGKPGSFSSYRVGPLGGTTRVQPGETRADAYRRLRADLAAMLVEEREARRAEFLAGLQKAFG